MNADVQLDPFALATEPAPTPQELVGSTRPGIRAARHPPAPPRKPRRLR